MLVLVYLSTSYLFTEVIRLTIIETGMIEGLKLILRASTVIGVRLESIDMMRIEVFVHINPSRPNNVCYLCHRLGHIAICCRDFKCYACGK